jgi:hypothetical protein
LLRKNLAVIQNWQTPEVNVESYGIDLYTCAWIEKLKSVNRGNIKAMSIHMMLLLPAGVTEDRLEYFHSRQGLEK